MKVSTKITSVVFFLLAVLAINSSIGLNQLSKIGQELDNVTSKDIAITEIITSITHHQLEKAVLFERAVRVAEELSFTEITPARREHLLASANLIKSGFNQLAQAGALNVMQGKELVEFHRQERLSAQTKLQLSKAQQLLYKIEQAHIEYDRLVNDILGAIADGTYELSFEDIDLISKKEHKLTNQLKELLEEVRNYTMQSVYTAKNEETKARQILWISFFLSLFISFVAAAIIIRNIHRPLSRLAHAAVEVGEGRSVEKLKDSARDELGEVSRAFNVMSQKLKDARQDLEQKNENLSRSLKLTEQQKKELERINRELDNMIHVISHDIKTPLTSITGYGAILDSRYKDKMDDKGQRCVDGLHKGVERLNAMVNDVLALSKTSRLKNPYEDVDVSSLIDYVKESLEFQTQEQRVEITVNDKMPVIRCDRIKLGIVFLNLVSNAVKFSAKSTVKPKVEIGYSEEGGFHKFYVRDNGIGIDPKHHAEIFEMFKRVHGVQEYEGKGVGLAIVKNIIETHKGAISIESQSGKGACFYFTISKNLT